MAKKILILENHRQTLTVLRSLAGAGYETIVGYQDRITEKFILSSRFTKEVWHHPMFDDEKEFIDALSSFLKRRSDIAYIFPIDSKCISLLTRYFDQISPLCGILMASPHATAICMDKSKTYELVSEQGIPQPETRVVRNCTEINSQIENIGYPFILKPKTSAKGLYGKKCIAFHSPGEFKKYFPKWPGDHSDLLFQKKVFGYRYNCNFTAINGRIVSYFETKTLRTVDYDYTGYAVDTISVKPSDKHRDYCGLLTHKIDYTGIGIIQFLVDEEDDSSWFLEFNPRMGASHALSYCCGVDFPKQAIDAYQYTSGEITSLPQYTGDYRFGIRLHWLFGDTSGLLKAVVQRNISISQMIGWSIRILCSLCKTVHHSTWSWKDPVPTLMLYKQEYLNIVKNRLRKKS